MYPTSYFTIGSVLLKLKYLMIIFHLHFIAMPWTTFLRWFNYWLGRLGNVMNLRRCWAVTSKNHRTYTPLHPWHHEKLIALIKGKCLAYLQLLLLTIFTIRVRWCWSYKVSSRCIVHSSTEHIFIVLKNTPRIHKLEIDSWDSTFQLLMVFRYDQWTLF